MSEQHPIDDIFQKGLGKYQAPVPAGMWDQVAQQQTTLRRQSRWRMAGIVGLALLFLSAIVAWWLPTQASLDSPQPGERPSTITATSPIAGTNTPLSDQNATIQESTTAVLPTEQPVITASVPQELSSTLTQTLPLANSVSQIAAENTEMPVSLNSSTTRSEIESSATLLVSPKLTAASTADEQLNSAAAEAGLWATDEVMSLPLPRLAPYSRPTPAPQLSTNSFTRSQRKALSIDLVAGFAYAHQHFGLKDEGFREERSAREISEFPEVSYLAGLRLNHRLSQHFSLSTGLFYTQIRNQFEYEQQTAVGSDSVNTILIRSSNRIRMMEVPLLIGYQLPGKRFSLAINAGPVVNLSTQARGRYLRPDSRIPVLLEEDNIYRSNIGISWQASLTAAYDLGDGNSLLIEPTFKSYPRSFTRNDYGLRENYWMAGLQVGLRHRIR